MSEAKNQRDEGLDSSRCSLALCVALATFIFGGILFLVGSAIYAAWTVHWSVGLIAALFALMIVMPEGTAEKHGDHTPW